MHIQNIFVDLQNKPIKTNKMNELNENTKEFLQHELQFIANCYLDYSRRVGYLEDSLQTKEDFIEDLLSMETYIDKIVRTLRK